MTLAYVKSSYTSFGGKTNKLTLVVNMGRFNNLSASDVNGEGGNSNSYLDRTLAHELTHAIMAAYVPNFNKLPQFINEGLAELVHGIDDERQDLIEYFAENFNWRSVQERRKRHARLFAGRNEPQKTNYSAAF